MRGGRVMESLKTDDIIFRLIYLEVVSWMVHPKFVGKFCFLEVEKMGSSDKAKISGNFQNFNQPFKA